jgi:glycosyltransferase involved in cell wall biosynthesis
MATNQITTEEKKLQKPLVSVIIPVFNRAKVINKTLDSIKSQIYRPIEVLVIDDGSSDQSVSIVENFRDQNPDKELTFQIYCQKNAGAPSARNHGIRMSEGKYLQFLDSDDTLEPEKISSQVESLENNDADIAVCDFRYDYGEFSENRTVKNQGNLYEKLVSGWSIYTSSPLIRAGIIKNHIRWNEKLRRQQDMDFLFKVFLLAPRYIYTPGVWCNYIQHDGGQISDTYQLTRPQYATRILSVLTFAYQSLEMLPRERKLMALNGVIFLFRQMFRFELGVLLRRIFGESFFQRIRNISQ